MQVNSQTTSQVMQTQPETATVSDNKKFQQALENFYEIHQQSQITGVSTKKYNDALNDLGLEADEALDAIHLLQSNGYSTGAPSVAAITKYGNTSQDVGNKSYMRHSEPIMQEKKVVSNEDTITVTEDTPEVKETENFNYYDTAVAIEDLLSDEDKTKNLSQLFSEVPTLQKNETTKPSTENLLEMSKEFIAFRTTATSNANNSLETLLQLT